MEQLYRAISDNDLEAVRAIIEADNAVVNSRDATPPPLHWAIFENQVETVELLLEYGADLDVRDQNRGATPLDYAIVYGRTGVVSLLIERGADPSGALAFAQRCAAGEFEDYEDLPSRSEYASIVALLQKLGVES